MPRSVRPVVTHRGALCALVALVIVVVDVRLSGPLTRVDHSIAARMLRWDLRDQTWPRRVISVGLWFGQRGVVLVGSGLLSVWAAWRLRTSEPLIRLVVAVVAVAVAVYALKVGLPRNAPLAYSRHQAAEVGASFPSGHAANAVLFWGLARYMTLHWAATGWLRCGIARGRLIAPWAVTASMLALNYHWLTDLIAGAMIGEIVLWVVVRGLWADVAAAVDRRAISRRHTRSRPSATSA